MLGSGELVPIVHHRVIRECVEFVIRSLGVVEEDSTVLMLQDRLELLVGRLLLERFNDKVLFAQHMVLIVAFVNWIDIVAPAPTPAPALLPMRSFGGAVSPAAPTPALATLGTAAPMELVQSISGNASAKHDLIPNILRPLSRLQTGRVNESGSTGPFVRDLPAFGDRGVTTRRQAVARCHG